MTGADNVGFCFYVVIDGHVEDAHVAAAVAELDGLLPSPATILGSFMRAPTVHDAAAFKAYADAARNDTASTSVDAATSPTRMVKTSSASTAAGSEVEGVLSSIGFLGPAATYTHQATIKVFGGDPTAPTTEGERLAALPTIKSVFDAVVSTAESPISPTTYQANNVVEVVIPDPLSHFSNDGVGWRRGTLFSGPLRRLHSYVVQYNANVCNSDDVITLHHIISHPIAHHRQMALWMLGLCRWKTLRKAGWWTRWTCSAVLTWPLLRKCRCRSSIACFPTRRISARLQKSSQKRKRLRNVGYG